MGKSPLPNSTWASVKVERIAREPVFADNGSAAPHLRLRRTEPFSSNDAETFERTAALRAQSNTGNFYLSFSVGGGGGGSSVFPARETISLPTCCFRVRAPLCRGRALQDAFITLPPRIQPIRADTASCCTSAITAESKMCTENSPKVVTSLPVLHLPKKCRRRLDHIHRAP